MLFCRVTTWGRDDACILRAGYPRRYCAMITILPPAGFQALHTRRNPPDATRTAAEGSRKRQRRRKAAAARWERRNDWEHKKT